MNSINQDDGSFKIETRDLQGNVKQGTYGYIDEHGEVKRVSYSTQNNTLFKEYQATTSSIKSARDEEENSDNETISLSPSTRYNRTFVSTTRRPSSLAFLTSTHGPTTIKPNQVVQAIPKRRILLSDRSTTTSQIVSSTDTSRQPIQGTTTLIYATSVPTPKPFLSRSTTSPNYSSNKKVTTEKGVEIDQVERKVFISTSKDVTTMKPILFKISEKNDEKFDLSKRGNSLRRQLKQEDEGFEAQQQILYGDGDESSAIYGSSFGNLRPLFTTTSQPKIPLQVLAARQRATQLQSILANSPGTTTTTERIYTKAPKRQSKIKAAEEVSEVVTENFLTQAPNVVEQIGSTEPSENDERRAFQRPLPPQLEGLYRPRNYLRQLNQQPPPPQQQLQQQQNIPEGALNGRFGQQQQQRNQQQPQQQQQSQNNYPEQQPSDIFPGAAYPAPFYPPQFPNRNQNPYDYDRPLTVRDFERLLQILVVRQQQQQPFRVNPYYPSTNPLAYPPFIPNYNQQPYSQIQRPPFYNPLSSGLFDPGYQNPYYSPSMPVSQHLNTGESMPQQFNPQQQQQSQQQQQQVPMDQEMQRFSRRRQYNSRFFSQQPSQQQSQQTQVQSPPIAPSEQEINYNSLQGPVDPNYIPPSVREQLLYRMLILALRPDGNGPPIQPQHHLASQQHLTSSASSLHSVLEPEQQETSSTIIKSTDNSSKKPVRSVQILGEEANE